MLLCNIADVKPGSKLAAAVIKDDAPDVELLKPGVTLEQRLLARLRSMGIRRIWINHDIAEDLDRVIDPHVMRTKLEMYRQLKGDLTKCSQKCISDAQVAIYQQVVSQLVHELVSAGRIGALTDSLFQCKGDQMTHGVNVAHLAILIGLQIESYIIRERPRLSVEHARDLVSLGLGAALHDVGKVGSSRDEIAAKHEVHFEQGDDHDDASRDDYEQHAVRGYEMLRDSRAPASACQAVLNHHQRFNGAGWPDLAQARKREPQEPLAGRRIHVFTRIVAAANVLDNLMRTPDGEPRPTVAALAEFAGPEYDGWFDPVVRRAALKCLPPFAIGSMVTLSDGRVGVVTCPSMMNPCRPVVRLLGESGRSQANGASRGSRTNEENEPLVVDLSQHIDLRVADCAGVDVTPWYFELPSVDELETQRAA